MANFDSVHDAIERVTTCGAPAQIFRELLRFVEPHGLTSFMAGTMPTAQATREGTKRHLWAERQPDGWTERYLQQRYVFDDPVIRRIHGEISPFLWSEAPLALGIETRQRMIMNEAREFGLSNGFTAPIILPDGTLGSVSFGGVNVDVAPEAVGPINLLAIYAMGRAVQLRSEAESSARAHLTRREIDALRWAAEGLTLSEIGERLGISDRTAEVHLKSAAVKLGATNRAHMIAEAFRARIIH